MVEGVFKQVGLSRRLEAGVARHELCADFGDGCTFYAWRKEFAVWITHKLMLTTTFVVQVCTSEGGLVGSIKLSSGSIMTLQLVATGCAVVGFLLMVRFASDSHRHLLLRR